MWAARPTAKSAPNCFTPARIRPAIGVTAHGTGGFSFGLTDGNGNYRLPVTPANWDVRPDDSSPAPLGYVTLSGQAATNLNVTGNVAGVNFRLPKGTALIDGQLLDELGNPVLNADFRAEDSPNSYYHAAGESFPTSGSYSIAVTAGTWNVTPEEDTLSLLGYVTPASSVQVSLASGQCLRLNFAVRRATNHITGYVKDISGNPIANLSVDATANISGTSYRTSIRTGANGYYSLNVANGIWSVSVDCSNDEGLPSRGYCCANSTSVNISNADGVANFTNIVSSGQLVITTPSPLPAAVQGQFYSTQISAASCAVVAFSATNPPVGLGLSSDGTLSGVPNAAGSNYFNVQVSDGAHVTNKWFTLISLTNNQAAGTMVLRSDASTLAAALGPGAPSGAIFGILDAGDLSGLTFEVALVGAFGSFTPIPSGAPAGTQVINLPPGDGENGFYKVTFVLPAGFQDPQLSGVANVDDSGRAFLNGNPLSPSMTSNDPGRIGEGGDAQFSTTDSALFRAGTNELVIADANTGSGPSGAAFYAVVTYQVSESSPGLLLTAPTWLGNRHFQFSFLSSAGTNYTVQVSTTLTTWTSILTFSGVEGPVTIVDPSASASRSFYRPKIGP